MKKDTNVIMESNVEKMDTYMVGTKVDETSGIVFMGVANEHHGNAYQSNE